MRAGGERGRPGLVVQRDPGDVPRRRGVTRDRQQLLGAALAPPEGERVLQVSFIVARIIHGSLIGQQQYLQFR